MNKKIDKVYKHGKRAPRTSSIANHKKEIKKIEARKGEDTYGFFKEKQKKGETMHIGEDFIVHLKKVNPELLATLLIK